MLQSPVYNLNEIAFWKEEEKVSLPTVQRGFVWRPFQIENLWDSLLRGYPVGAFVLTPKADKSFEMLDGQQRATAICLGFGKDTFRNSQDNIKVFIDLDRPKKDDNRKYIFRVITKSHPWGYQRTDNTKTLTADNIRKAMFLYEVDDHLEANLNQFFPFDATFPIPFNLFIDAAIKNESAADLIKKIKSSSSWKKVNKQWEERIKKIEIEKLENPDSKKELPALSTENKIYARIAEILTAVQNMVDADRGQKIPALYLNNEDSTKELDNKSFDDIVEVELENDDQEEDNLNAEDEIENLFIRLNAGGTPLRGEELNYSILKSKIDKNLQKRIEDTCIGLFNPSRFITIAYRLFQQEKKQDNRDALTMKVKPKQFQRTVNEEKSIKDFSGFLNKVFTKKEYAGRTLLEHARYLLEYEEKGNSYGLPYLMLFKIADLAPEVMFMYLYRLKFHQDEFRFNTNIHRRMIGMITLFMWLGRGENQRDHARLLANIWPAAKGLEKELFWSSSTVQRAQLNNILTPFPSFDRKHDRKSLIKFRGIKPQNNTEVFLKFDQMTSYGQFVDQMFYNRDLILYAQRKFLSKIFKQKEYHLDDTNMPFDWDHISPNRFVHKKPRIPKIVKQWYNTIGNFRAWPYSLNRMDQDNSPASKFSPLDPSQIDNYDENKKSWLRFIAKNNNLIKSIDDLPTALLDWSFCNNEDWANCEATDMKDRPQWKEVYHLILNRNLAICKEWYKQLKIEDLMSAEENAGFSDVVNKTKWNINLSHDKILKDEFQSDEDISWVSKPVLVGKANIYFFFVYSKYSELLLGENAVTFGLFEKSHGNFLNAIKIPESFQKEYESGKGFIRGGFTLISNDEVAYLELFKSFKGWLKIFPNNKEINSLVNPFVASLAAKFKRKLQ